MQDATEVTQQAPRRYPWNKGKLTGAKPPLRPKHVWSSRSKLQLEGRLRDLAMFNLAIDSKLRGCDVISLKVEDAAPHGHAVDRAAVRQKKTGPPVRFELTEQARKSTDAYLGATAKRPGEFLFTGRGSCVRCLTARQYARLVSQWIGASGLDPSDEGAAYLQHWGVPAADVTVTGIPIHPVFSQAKDRASCLARQGLVGDRPIVLQLSGGFGVGPIERIFRGILAIDVPLEVVVVAGRNEDVKRQLEHVTPPAHHRVKILGFTDQIDELMAVADIVVSKPGGLTTSEVLASGAAMAVVNPIPGQESRNSDFLLENGAAVKINNIATLAHKLTPLLREPSRLAKLKDNARRIGKPQAAFDDRPAALAWPA